MKRVDMIRAEEKKYHDECYKQHKLFEKGSWLYKPVQTVLEMLPKIKEIENPNVLDLGSGVGRNSIPIAEAVKSNRGKVVCVDLLESAIENLLCYSKQFEVEQVIEPYLSDIEGFEIREQSYDFVVAVSSLEHVSSELTLKRVLTDMEKGTKPGGLVCLVINTEVTEIDLHTGESLDALIEVNLSTYDMIHELNPVFKGWKLVKHLVKPLEYNIERNGVPILLKTNAVTYVVQNKRGCHDTDWISARRWRQPGCLHGRRPSLFNGTKYIPAIYDWGFGGCL